MNFPQAKEIRWVELIARTGKMKNAYIILLGKREGKRVIGRPKRRGESSIAMDLRRTGLEMWVDSSGLG